MENEMENKTISKRSRTKPIVKKGGSKKLSANINNRDNNKKRRTVKQDEPVNEYYYSIAFRLKFARLILLFFLIIFVIVSVILNSKELTIDNLSQLLRYIDIQNSEKVQVFEFSIDIDEDSCIGYYKNNIVVLKRNKLDVYDLNGKRNFSHTLTYSMPVLEISDKYILAFDSGANKMQIFNSFSKLYEYKSKYNEINPIYGAKITDKGNIVYITSEKGYKCVVKIMNNSFTEVYECCFGDKYIVDADIDNEAKKLAIAGFSGKNGDFLGEILLYDTGSDDENYQRRIVAEGEIPLRVNFNKSGLFAIFENSLQIFDENYDKLENYNFLNKGIEYFRFTPECAAVILGEKTLGNEKSILIFNYLGELLYSEIINTEIIDIKFSEDSTVLYFLTRSGLYKIDIHEKKFELMSAAYDETAYKIIYADDKNIFVSGLTKVNIIKIEN